MGLAQEPCLKNHSQNTVLNNNVVDIFKVLSLSSESIFPAHHQPTGFRQLKELISRRSKIQPASLDQPPQREKQPPALSPTLQELQFKPWLLRKRLRDWIQLYDTIEPTSLDPANPTNSCNSAKSENGNHQCCYNAHRHRHRHECQPCQYYNEISDERAWSEDSPTLANSSLFASSSSECSSRSRRSSASAVTLYRQNDETDHAVDIFAALKYLRNVSAPPLIDWKVTINVGDDMRESAGDGRSCDGGNGDGEGTIELDVQSSETNSCGKERGIPFCLRDIWPYLMPSQKSAVIPTLVQILAVIWKEYDILFATRLDFDDNSDYAEANALDCQETHDMPRGGDWDDIDLTTWFSLGGQATVSEVTGECVVGVEPNLNDAQNSHSCPSYPRRRMNGASPPVFAQSLEKAESAFMSGCQIHCSNSVWQQPVPNRTQSLLDLHSQQSQTSPPLSYQPQQHDQSPRQTTPRTRIHPGMSLFDFSLDDIQVVLLAPEPTSTVIPDPMSFGDDEYLQPQPITTISESLDDLLPTVKVIGIGHWITAPSSPPSSKNYYQQQANSSSVLYPLLHLFSLPDIFCKTTFGGLEPDLGAEADADQCGSSRNSDENDQLSFQDAFLAQLAEASPGAFEFMTDEIDQKKLRIYRHWLIAFHSKMAPQGAIERGLSLWEVRRGGAG